MSHKIHSAITLESTVEKLLQNGATLLVSVSGGKDSDCMALELARLHIHLEHDWPGDLLLIHADTGMEWRESEPHCHQLADRLGVELVVLRHDHTLLEGIHRRMMKRPDAVSSNVTSEKLSVCSVTSEKEYNLSVTLCFIKARRKVARYGMETKASW